MAKGDEICLFGDWDKAQYILAELDNIADDNLTRSIKKSANKLRDAIKDKIAMGDPRWPRLHSITKKRKGHSRPLQDTNELANSISVKKIRAQIGYTIGIPKTKIDSSGTLMYKRALMMEYGGTIKPKSAKMLAIPLTQEAETLSILYRGVKNIPNLIRRKGGKIIYKKGTSEAMFLLKDRVTIPPRSFLGSTLRSEKRNIYRRWRYAVKKAIEGKRII